MEIIFTPEAQEHLLFWKHSGKKNIMQKITDLLESIVETPFQGIGKPGPF